MEDKLKEAQEQLINRAIEEAKEHGSNTMLLEKQLNKTPGQLASENWASMEFEPIRRNRFLVQFPNSFNIDPWYVESIKMPKITKKKWENTEINIRQLIPLMNHTYIMDIIGKTNFQLKVNLLDPTGVIICGWDINIKKVISIDFGGLFSYKNDSIAETAIILKTKNCIMMH